MIKSKFTGLPLGTASSNEKEKPLNKTMKDSWKHICGSLWGVFVCE